MTELDMPEKDQAAKIKELEELASYDADLIDLMKRNRDIQQGNAERWKALAMQYKRELERRNSHCQDCPTFVESDALVSNLTAEIERLREVVMEKNRALQQAWRK